MDRMTIKYPVRVLARVTDSFRKQIRSSSEREIEHIETELERMNFREKQLETELSSKRNASESKQAREALREQKQQMQNRRSELRAQLAQLEQLENGDLIHQGTVEAEAEISPGSCWDELMSASIIVEDGEVVDIRRGGFEE